MPAVCFYFQVHQPYRIKKYSVFSIGQDHDYFSTEEDRLNNEKIFNKVANKCYLPTNELLFDLINTHPEFKISFSLSGVFLDQAREYNPKVLDSFKRLVDTGRVEMLDETYHHSLSSIFSEQEFADQVKLHNKEIKKIFGYKPKVFRNTELIYNNQIAKKAEELGYLGILAEGIDHILGHRNANFVYRPKDTKKIKLLLKNYRLSDDIAFRFSQNQNNLNHVPINAQNFSQWISDTNGNGHLVNLFMDYETFGEHQWKETGIFEFLKHLPAEILKNPSNGFVTPTEAIKKYEHFDELDFPHHVSWADTERDLSAWLSNPLQQDAIKKLYELEKDILKTKDKKLVSDWRRMQTSDHFYYMCTKWFQDGDVHKYFNPYESPYDAFINFMNILNDLKFRIKDIKKLQP